MTDMPVYYINLASRPDRRDHMERQFQRLGMAAERIEAVTASNVEQLVIEKEIPAEALHTLTAGEIACSLSHRLAWTKALEAGAQSVLILEDDALIAPALTKISLEMIRTLRTGLIKLDTSSNMTVRLGSRTYEPVEGVRLRVLYSRPYGCGGYIVTDRVMREWLKSHFHHRIPVDNFVFSNDLLRHRTMQASPTLVTPFSDGAERGAIAVGSSDLEVERVAKRRSSTAAGQPSRLTRLRTNWPIIWALMRHDPLVLLKSRELVHFAGLPDQEASGR